MKSKSDLLYVWVNDDFILGEIRSISVNITLGVFLNELDFTVRVKPENIQLKPSSNNDVKVRYLDRTFVMPSARIMSVSVEPADDPEYVLVTYVIEQEVLGLDNYE